MLGFFVECSRNLLEVRVVEEFFLNVVELLIKREELAGLFHHLLRCVLALPLIQLHESNRSSFVIKVTFNGICLLSFDLLDRLPIVNSIDALSERIYLSGFVIVVR